MAVADDSYLRLLAEWHKRDDYESTFRSTLGELANQVDFSWIRSCVAFGTGGGEDEIAFARRLLTNLRTFVAVEPDPESIKAIQANFENGQLPGVEATVRKTVLERWNGIDDPSNAALLFNVVLFHVKSEDRRALFEKLADRHLKPGAVVVIVEDESASGFMRLVERLSNTNVGEYKDVEEEMLSAGFRLVLTRSITGRRDLSNPTDDVLKYIELLLDRTILHEEIRTAIADIFSQPNLRNYKKILAIFQK